uniref:Thioredoxin domain-containing protein n=1 Tax=Hemiselmis tepida TaxID=464990 RepID=A0A7S0W9L7_9CRYP|mmetsp:Transcript_6718/g.17174  ORF Transcript_6718/g.17174 Transcript_6718/m.17174 type:complete len:258 (+) Transcript_6718:739-1512(+)
MGGVAQNLFSPERSAEVTARRDKMQSRLIAIAAVAAALLVATGAEAHHDDSPYHLAVRKPAPPWSGPAVLNGEFQDLSSQSLIKDKKWVVLFFYPLDFTFVCPTEIVEFDNRLKDFKALGAEVIGVSVDSKHTHLAWTRTAREDGGVGNIKYPLLSDLNKEIARNFGVLVEDEDDEHQGVTMRATFIIDPAGIIRSMSVHDEPIGRSVDETLRLLESAQFAAANKGKGCPANWKKGDKPITANRKDSLDWFKTWGSK